MIKLPSDINMSQGAVIVIAWSMILIAMGTYIGATIIDVDCDTCEAALDVSIDKLEACELKLLTGADSRCEDERQTERKRCEATLTEYKRLRCKICEISHDTYPPEPNLTREPAR